jgi:hypothetical protein
MATDLYCKQDLRCWTKTNEIKFKYGAKADFRKKAKKSVKNDAMPSRGDQISPASGQVKPV